MTVNDNKQELFKQWLSRRGLSQSSIAKYATQAHNKIVKDLGISFYTLTKSTDLAQLLNDVRLMEKQMEHDPKRMYSSAVSNYIKFISESADLKNTLDDANYENDINQWIATNPANHFSSPAKLVTGSTTRYARNPQVGATAIVLANYSCQINNNHQTFTSRTTHRNYVEAHHLIPIAYQAMLETVSILFPTLLVFVQLVIVVSIMEKTTNVKFCFISYI
ncbi:hypothetical protein [Enterococcus nangangensis]|uniref:hypothetical protein n=1 Tax=Enterococcus nangangensis TaxID=2559926 RepID=UPI0010F9C42C|nr:hypothetical protein [Enterococcus nangangensis]